MTLTSSRSAARLFEPGGLISQTLIQPLPLSDNHIGLASFKMPMPGYVFKDGGPIPDSDLKDPQHPANQQPGATPVMEQADEQPMSRTRTSASNISSNSNSVTSIMNTPTSSASASNAPSDSHALASADDHEVKGAVQTDHQDGEVRDMGWNDHPHDVPPLVGGLPNEELWTLVRRFNKQMYHVKATNEHMIGGLDCYIVDEDEFSPDKLRSNIERLYMTVIIGLMGFGKHVARLRSWREPRRTGAFCAVCLTGNLGYGVKHANASRRRTLLLGHSTSLYLYYLQP